MSLRSLRSACAAAVVLAQAGCGDSQVTEPGSTGRPLNPVQKRGAEVLTDTGCLACHRLNGAGTKGTGSDLTNVGARRTEAQIRKALLEPPSTMPPYTSLSEPDLDALVAYLAAQR